MPVATMSAPAYHAVPKGEGAASLQPPPATTMESNAAHGLAGPRSTEASEYGPYGRLGRRSQLTPSPATTNYADEPRSASSLSNSAEKLPKSRLSSVTVIDVRERELDDALHDPRGSDRHSSALSYRGLLNMFTLLTLIAALLMLFAGYPILHELYRPVSDTRGAFNIGGTNGSGQVPLLSALRPLRDPESPPSAYTWRSAIHGTTLELQFSDEFNTPGRTFWPGDDQFWTAQDIWYGGTFDLEWYTPESINTTDGALVITMTDIPSHNLNFQSGMLQSWNQVCFQGGYIEFAIIQPGSHTRQGYWPGAWIMGNLGRPGHLATTDGMWPYSYQGCDTGVLENQTNAMGGPVGAVDSTAVYADNGQLSKLPGMRTPSCTCAQEDHPGPNVNVGRSAPEIDALEAQIERRGGVVNGYASQSFQTAPFDDAYFFVNDSLDAMTIHDTEGTTVNVYKGGPFQQAVSAIALTPQRGFEDFEAPDEEKWVTYGLEYEPDWDNDGGGYITWYVDDQPTWTITGAALPPRPEMEIGQRNIPTEPMSIIMNLGISPGFQAIDFDPTTGVKFPAQMKVDYVRVYQERGKERTSCDPPDHPTKDYIDRHIDAYMNANLTRWTQAGYDWPRNRARGDC